MTNTQKVLSELKHGGRVSRYTAIQKNLAENLTATISQLRKKGYHIVPRPAFDEKHGHYTRYKLMDANPSGFADESRLAA
jgi:hypothetical protein